MNDIVSPSHIDVSFLPCSSVAEQFSSPQFMADTSSHVQLPLNLFGTNNCQAYNLSWSSSQTPVTPHIFLQLPLSSCQSYQPLLNIQSHNFPFLRASNLIPSAATIVSASTSKAVASLSCLKNVNRAEQNTLVKMAPKLSYKSLYPTNLERQQVSLVLTFLMSTMCRHLNITGLTRLVKRQIS